MHRLKPFFGRLWYVLLFTLSFYCATAQTEINTSYSDRVNYIFQVEKNRVPHGLLLDYAMEFTRLSNFNGTVLTDTNMVMPPEFWEIYNTLYLSRIHPNGFTIMNPSVFDSLWYSQRDYGKIVLSGLFYNYSRFRDDAAQNNLVNIQNDQVSDRYVNGIWQDPYQQEKVFAISPSIEFYEGKNLQVILPSSLWQTNAAGEVSNLSIDCNDGLGYRTLTPGQALTLNYSDTGMKVWTYRLQLTTSQYLYSHSQVRVKNAVVETGCINCRFGTSNPEVIAITADEAYLGTAGRAFITIRYRDPDLGLRRPLIVAEGFDAGHITSPELRFGSSTIASFFDNVATSNSTTLQAALAGSPADYDIIYVDWRNGTDYLQRNGLLLETIIRWVNANKEQLPGGGFADNVILGQSMGGAITRWALRDMETRLSQQHHTRMYISMDAPQQGANVPAAYQHLARHFRNLYLQTYVWGVVEIYQLITGGPSPYRILNLSNQPGARQMLINWVNNSGTIDNTMHNQWQAELRTLGYPTQNSIRNIAISNGAECGTPQPFSPGAELLNIHGKAHTRFLGDLIGQTVLPLAGGLLGFGYIGILPGRNDFNFDMVLNAQPPQGTTQRIYHATLTFTKKILWLVPINITLFEKNNNSDPASLPYDYYPGGQIDTHIDLSVPKDNFLVKFGLSFYHIPTFCFIPTPSALDIGSNNVTLTNADYLAQYIGGAPPATPKNSPFVNFVTAFNGTATNEQHIGFFQRNGNWLAQELPQTGTPPAANCSAFCNLFTSPVTGSDAILCNTTYSVPLVTGATYSWFTSSNLIINGSNTGNSVQVAPNTVGGTGWVAVFINTSCGASTVLRKNITLTDLSAAYITGWDINIEVTHPMEWNVLAYKWYMDGVFFRQTNAPLLKTAYAYECHDWSVSFVTACGDSPETLPESVGCGYLVASAPTTEYSVYPNPVADNAIAIHRKEKQSAQQPGLQGGAQRGVKTGRTPAPQPANTRAGLYDPLTYRVVRQWTIDPDRVNTRLDVQGLRKGTYVLFIMTGKYRQTQQVVIQ